MIIEPNWRKAPKWAKYWAVDSDNVAYWYKNKPICRGSSIDAYDNSGCWKVVGNNRFGEKDFEWDSSWPPEGFDNEIDWENTLRKNHEN